MGAAKVKVKEKKYSAAAEYRTVYWLMAHIKIIMFF